MSLDIVVVDQPPDRTFQMLWAPLVRDFRDIAVGTCIRQSGRWIVGAVAVGLDVHRRCIPPGASTSEWNWFDDHATG